MKITTKIFFVLLICNLFVSSCTKKTDFKLDRQLREQYCSPMLFEVLGYIDDYMGRGVNSMEFDHIDHFYMSQKDAADRFEILLDRFKEQYNLETEIIRQDSEYHIDFYSKEIADIVNSCYKSTGFTKLDNSDGSTVGKVYNCILDDTFFNTASEEEMLGYLKGAYSRHGEKNYFRFTNSIDKFNLVCSYLAALNCINIKTMHDDLCPTSNVICFQPSKKVQDALGITSYCDIILKDVDANDYLQRNLIDEPLSETEKDELLKEMPIESKELDKTKF